MNEQNYSNHRRIVKGFHILFYGLVLAGLIASIINLNNAIAEENFSAKLLLLLFVISVIGGYYMRAFALKAQDRAIRAEESLRMFALNGKLPDGRLNIAQIIALRFAPDEELLALHERAVNENLSPNDIKKSITNWKPDHHRV